jgi:hypothetical protein
MAQEEFLDHPMPDVIEQWRLYFSVLNPQSGDRSSMLVATAATRSGS